MIQDLHSHTYYSFCGRDDPRDVVEAAINGGIGMIGITDHNYGIGYGRFDVFTSPGAESFNGTYERTLRRYYDHIDLIRDKYAGKIEVKRGIELCTLKDGGSFKNHCLPDGADISFFDYCLIENLDNPISVTGGDIFAYAKRCGTPLVGIAHTDMFSHIKNRGEDPLEEFVPRLHLAVVVVSLDCVAVVSAGCGVLSVSIFRLTLGSIFCKSTKSTFRSSERERMGAWYAESATPTVSIFHKSNQERKSAAHSFAQIFFASRLENHLSGTNT